MTVRALVTTLFLSLGLFGVGIPAAYAETSDLESLLGTPGSGQQRVDVGGKALGPEALRDRLAVVSFVSVGCSIVCVTRTMDIDKLARNLPESLRGRVVFLTVDLDPATDDAVRLGGFVTDLLGPAPHLRALPSNAAGVKVIVESLHYPAASLPEPPPSILLFDRRGRVAMVYGSDPLDTSRLQRDLAALDTFSQGLGHSPLAAPGRAQSSH